MDSQNLLFMGLQSKLGSLSNLLEGLRKLDKQREKEEIIKKIKGTVSHKKNIIQNGSKNSELRCNFHRKVNPKTQLVVAPNPDPKLDEKLASLKKIAADAAKQEKIFSVSTAYDPIRKELLKRGWIEKVLNKKSLDLAKVTAKDLENESEILSTLIKQLPNFIFNSSNNCPLTPKNVYFNQIQIGQTKNFSLKNGLHECTLDQSLANTEGVSCLDCPLTFVINSAQDIDNFIQFYLLLLCRNLVCYLNENIEKFEFVYTKFRNITLFRTINLACSVVDATVRNCKEHLDIDSNAQNSFIPNHVWDELINCYKIVVNGGTYKVEMVLDSDKDIITNMIQRSAKLATDCWGNHKDLRNIWILKPYNRCGGKGITVLDDFTNIVVQLRRSLSSGCFCVVQKYIETPLLIYGNKFDIRQFMLVVTGDNDLWIWAHDLLYIRFSSQKFTLDNLHESIHLTNRSIQKQYTNLPRNNAVPSYNHWSRADFEEYLMEEFKQPGLFDEQILAKLHENMIGIVLSALDEIELRSNKFCLFGLDFLISDDFKVYLLEVNNHPGLNDATEVTAPIFKEVMEDLVKVIVDWKSDQSASTGKYKLLHHVNVPTVNQNANLQVEGTRLHPPVYWQKSAHAATPIKPKVLFKHSSTVLAKLANEVKFERLPNDNQESKESDTYNPLGFVYTAGDKKQKLSLLQHRHMPN